MDDVVLMNVEDGVATLTLNRPDRLNAWTAEKRYATYFDRARGMRDPRRTFGRSS